MISTDIYGFWSVCRCPMCPRSHGTHKIEMVRRIIWGVFWEILSENCTDHWVYLVEHLPSVRQSQILLEPTRNTRFAPLALRAALAAALLSVSATLVMDFSGASSSVTSISDMLSSYSPPSMISISNRGDGFQAWKVVILSLFLSVFENEKVKNFLPLARSRNPQNPRILDNLEGKPLGLLADSAGQNNLIFSYLISAEVLRFLKFYIRYPRRYADATDEPGM